MSLTSVLDSDDILISSISISGNEVQGAELHLYEHIKNLLLASVTEGIMNLISTQYIINSSKELAI